GCRCGRVQDLGLGRSMVEYYLGRAPGSSTAELSAFNAFCEEIKRERPLVGDESIDVILSNCVLNLVRPEDKEQLFAEMFRVARRGGRVVISDIVSDEDVPEDLQNDPELWSGCISGAYREDAFLEAFDRAGFHGMEVIKRDECPWRTVRGIELRSVTVAAHKCKQGPSLQRK